MIFVFDLGNVLIPWDRRFLYEQLIDDPVELDDFLDSVLTLEENAVLDRGVPLADMTADLAERKPEYRELIEAFALRWKETTGPVIQGSLDILQQLKATGETCYALSNWGADTFAMVRDEHSWFDLFDGMLISGHEGVVKPDPEIFTLLCDRYDIAAANAFFIDDSVANIATADAMGFVTHLFTEPDLLRADLEQRALLARSGR